MEKDYYELQSRVDSQTSQPYDLQTEIFELNDQKNDLESSLRLNRSILRQMISKSDLLIEKIIENEKFYSQLQSKLKERNDSQIRSLLSEQIAEEAHRREFETISEFEEKIQELKYFAYRKELFTQELRKKLAILEEEMEQEKAFRKAHVVPPTPEILDLYNQLQEIKTKVFKIKKLINQVSEQRDTIIEKSDFLQFENDKIKTLLKNPLHRNQPKNKQQFKKFVKPQLRLVERSFDQFYKGHQQFSENESENSSSLEEIQFPLKFQKNNSELTSSKAKIPQLNLSNVKNEIQPNKNGMAQRLNIREEQTQKKQKQVHLTPNEQKLEMLLEKLKNRYSDCQEFSTNLGLETQKIQKQIKHYQNQNNQLASALQNQNRKKVIGNNQDFIKKKVKSKLKRQNSNPLDYVDIVEDHLDQLGKSNIPIFNLNFAKSARPLQHFQFINLYQRKFPLLIKCFSQFLLQIPSNKQLKFLGYSQIMLFISKSYNFLQYQPIMQKYLNKMIVKLRLPFSNILIGFQLATFVVPRYNDKLNYYLFIQRKSSNQFNQLPYLQFKLSYLRQSHKQKQLQLSFVINRSKFRFEEVKTFIQLLSRKLFIQCQSFGFKYLLQVSLEENQSMKIRIKINKCKQLCQLQMYQSKDQAIVLKQRNNLIQQKSTSKIQYSVPVNSPFSFN